MKNAKFTKGKWKTLGVSKKKEWVNIDSEKGIIARAFFGDMEPIVDEYEAKANALLISKSPEMLEMLIELKDTLADGRTFGYNDYDRVEKLIEEATEL